MAIKTEQANESYKTSIIILSYNNIWYTRGCIESIRLNTEPESYELIVVDNNSTDGTCDWLLQQSDIKCILNSENAGFPKGCNQGITEANPQNDILLLNNDTVVTTNWLTNLHSCLYSGQEIGAVGAVTNSCSNFQVMLYPYIGLAELAAFAQKNNISDSSRWEERLRLVGFCMLIKNVALKKIGLLDEIYSPGNFEDDDFCLRLRQGGYRLMLCHDSFIHHYGSATFGSENTKYANILETNRKQFTKKWGIDPFVFSDERYYIGENLPQRPPANILHINSSAGGTLMYLKHVFPLAFLCGVEEDKRLLINLNHLGQIVTDIQCFNEMQFEMILLSAMNCGQERLLENVTQVLRLVAQSFTMLIICSFPNELTEQLRRLLPTFTIKAANNLVIIKQNTPEQ